MEEDNIEIYQVDSTTFEKETYSVSDTKLMLKISQDTDFDLDRDYIEFYVYDENKKLLYPEDVIPLNSFNVRQGDILLDPQRDLKSFGFDIGRYYISYNFYRKRLSSSPTLKYYIKEISSDRTEIRLASNAISNQAISSGAETFNAYRNLSQYFVDFDLNFGGNNTIIANNLQLDTSNAGDSSLLIKLYEPLPAEYSVKSECWIVEKLSKSQSYEVFFPFIPVTNDSSIFLSGPNLNLNITQQSGEAGQLFSYNTLLNSDITSSTAQLKNLLDSKEININIDYSDYSQFVNFSSAQTRLENFYYKVGIIESASKELSQNLGNIAGATTTTAAYSSSKAALTSTIDNTINNFDGYEYFLYFNSGSDSSYPKSNTEPPFTLYSTGSTEVLQWIGSADTNSLYYGGQALSASNYDQDNQDWLYWAIPEYLRSDPDNLRYELYLDMIGQHFDNIWVYTKDITEKYNTDNRINFGVSKDIVAQAIRDFGVKLYSNNFNTDDLFTAFLGLTPSGSLFPFPNITGSIGGQVNTPTGYEYIDTKISSSNDVIPLDDTNKRLYKRIYHNIPYLLKTKGTVAGLRALITSYGIPDTMLRINEFGGKDKNENTNWDFEQNTFNYAFNTGQDGKNFITSSFNIDDKFGNTFPGSVGTVQLRFKPNLIPTGSDNLPSPLIHWSQSLWATDNDLTNPFDNPTAALVLVYTGSGFVTGSYSGSVPSEYDTWGTLKFFPDVLFSPSVSCSVYAPFFDGGWWSAQMVYEGDGSAGALSTVTASLYAANQINGEVGFSGSSTVLGVDGRSWNRSDIATLNHHDFVNINLVSYEQFTGSFQELRYWGPQLSESIFYDYVLNPYSVQGNDVNSTPNTLAFRADLGTELNTASRESIHPRITGSAVQITQSFNEPGNVASSFLLKSTTTTPEAFITNVEDIYENQVIAGIKNRVSENIQLRTANMPAPPSGSDANVVALSALESIQQENFESGSYSPRANYLEVAFSPANQINDDINAQIGYFNIGDYIGDPRQILSSSRSYPDLDGLRDDYFEKYFQNYDVNDFVRLIKFFDNSLFQMIEDFTPARTSLASGLVVKQHLLERNRQRQPLVSQSFEDYSGSIKPFPRDYNTGSGDTGAYEFISGSSIYRFSGGPGGSLNRYNGLNTSPSQSIFGLSNKYFLTQSYSESIEGSVANTINNSGSFVGYGKTIIDSQHEFYDGEFSGSNIQATTQSLNPGCDPYLRVVDTPITLNPLFFSLDQNRRNGTVSSATFAKRSNYPKIGDVWIAYAYNDTTNQTEVAAIKFPTTDLNGNFIRDYIDDSNTIEFFFQDGITTYYINSVDRFTNGVYVTIDNTQGDFTTFFDPNGGSENWSLDANGSYNTRLTINTESADLDQQGVFLNPTLLTQNQSIYTWDGSIADEQKYFNKGDKNDPPSVILGTENVISGSYFISNSSNIPWIISASIVISSSNTNFDGTGTVIGTYHSGTSYPNTAEDQSQFVLNAPGNVTGVLLHPSPIVTDLNDTLYQTSYNNLIPGNSGSGLPLVNRGGNPKFRLSSTSSLEWYFPSFQFSGSAPQEGTLANFTAFSASFLEAGNGIFASNGNTNSQTSQLVNFTNAYATTDGVIEIDLDELEYYSLQNPQNPSQGAVDDVQTLISVGFKPRYTFRTPSLLNISSSYQYLASTPSPTSNWLTFNNQISTGLQDPNTGEGVYKINPTSYTTALIPTGNALYVRPVFKSNLSTFDYEMTEYDLDITWDALVQYDGGATFSETHTITNVFTSTGQANQSNGDDNVANPFRTIIGLYGRADLQAHLKVTGSNSLGAGIDRIITSSDLISNQQVSTGFQMTFPDGAAGILVNNDVPYDYDNPTVNTQSTRTEPGDMYYIEYSMSNYVAGIGGEGLAGFVADLENNSNTETKIFITSSFTDATVGYDCTASLYVTKGNQITNNNSFGSSILSDQFIIDNEAQNGIRFTLAGSYEYEFIDSDFFRVGVDVSKNFASGFEILEYSMSIFPSQSDNARILGAPAYNNFRAPVPTGLFIPTFFGSGVTPFNKALDCQPLLNNYNTQRANSFIMDVDYSGTQGNRVTIVGDTTINSRIITTTNTIGIFEGQEVEYTDDQFSGNVIVLSVNPNTSISVSKLAIATSTGKNISFQANTYGILRPSNLAQILSNTATKATIPDSNYTSPAVINPRYDGVKSTCALVNEWNIKDTGTYGKLPNIELRDAFFGYFNDLSDDYPNINGLTRVNLNFLVDEQSNALPPSLPSIGVPTLKSVFPVEELTSIAVQSGSSQYKVLGDNVPVKELLKYYEPIMYSQNSAHNYTNDIQLSGSGYVSRYDNDDENSQVFQQFTVQGTASTDQSQPLQVVEYAIDPNEQLTQNPQNTGGTNPWVQGGNNSALYPSSGVWGGSTGDDLANEQVVSMKHSIFTTYVSETKGTRDELRFEIHAYTGSNDNTEISFNLEDIECRVYTEDGKVTNIGSALDYGWFDVKNIIEWRKRKTTLKSLRYSFSSRNRWRTTRIPIPTGGIKVSADWEMYDTLFDRGLMRERKPKNGSGVIALEWIITLNTGNYTIKINDDINFKIKGSFKNARSGHRQGYFFPDDYTGVKTPTRIQGQGVYDHLLSESNVASSPFWLVTGSGEANYLVMSSSNMNEAYGQSFKQADLDYFPGASEYFPGGVEPADTSFDTIKYPLQLFTEDQIRFANNENFTYNIVRVWGPDENIESDGIGKLKIELSEPISSGSTNLDFFLVRRPIDSPNSLYLDTPFPYETLGSASIKEAIFNTGSLALTGSNTVGTADAEGNYTGSVSSLESQMTPGILYPNYPTDYLIQSASIIVNDLISKGVIQS